MAQHNPTMMKMMVVEAKNRGMMINNYAGPMMSSKGFNSKDPYGFDDKSSSIKASKIKS